MATMIEIRLEYRGPGGTRIPTGTIVPWENNAIEWQGQKYPFPKAWKDEMAREVSGDQEEASIPLALKSFDTDTKEGMEEFAAAIGASVDTHSSGRWDPKNVKVVEAAHVVVAKIPSAKKASDEAKPAKVAKRTTEDGITIETSVGTVFGDEPAMTPEQAAMITGQQTMVVSTVAEQTHDLNFGEVKNAAPIQLTSEEIRKQWDKISWQKKLKLIKETEDLGLLNHLLTVESSDKVKGHIEARIAELQG